MSTEADARRWLELLTSRLNERAAATKIYSDYFHGKQKLAFASESFLEAFGGRFGAFADNWCRLVVEAPVERLKVEGFRFTGSTEPDAAAWELWQANRLDAESLLGHREAMICGVAYGMVWPSGEGSIPTITIEHPGEVITASASGDRNRRTAALKRWYDDELGRACATVYLPDAVYKFQSGKVSEADAKVFGVGSKWEQRNVEGEKWPLANPLGVVPVVPIVNNPRLTGIGESEIAPVLCLQDAANKTLMDALVASEFAGFPQRWATGYIPEEDPESNEKLAPPWKAGAHRLWWSEDTELKFGQFDTVAIDGYVKFIDMIVQHIASQSRTPPHYLNPGADRLSGESIKAAETGLVSKVRQKQLFFGEAWEEIVRLGLAAMGHTSANDFNLETIWTNPEIRSESELVDSVSKKVAMLGVPKRQGWTDVGYSQTEQSRFGSMLAAERLDIAASAMFAPPAP